MNLPADNSHQNLNDNDNLNYDGVNVNDYHAVNNDDNFNVDCVPVTLIMITMTML